MTGIYIHVPYCVKKCGYCDFYSVCDLSSAPEYANAVCRDLSRLQSKADTLYFGGGTPSLIGADLLSKMIDSATPRLTDNAEITVEVNPGDDTATLIPTLARVGVNRLSIGMQSHCDNELTLLTRRHKASDVDRAIEIAHQSGITNISLDVMLGIEGQTIKSLDSTLKFCADSGATHVSAYMLKIEDGTPFSIANYRPQDELQADMYLHTVESLSKLGFEQYEISNFCRGSKRSRHNMKYWTGEDYIGLGSAAHSYINGKRFYYPRSISSYIKGEKPIQDGVGGTFEEKIMLGLRLSDGVNLNQLAIDHPDQKAIIENIVKTASDLCKAQLAYLENGVLSLTAKGFLVSNQIISILI